MRIQWSGQTFRWFEAASAYTGFHSRLADMLSPHIARSKTMIDLGCGAGMIDLELASAFDEITCLDTNEEVLAYLDGKIAEEGLAHVRTQRGDAHALEGKWDIVFSSFFGRLGENIEHYLRLCNHAVIAVVHADNSLPGSLADYHPPKCNSCDKTKAALDAKGIRYTALEPTLEYGQPFTSREEAAAFVRMYEKNPPDVSIDTYLNKRLMETGKAQYPYYMPNPKTFGLFIIRREDNAHI